MKDIWRFSAIELASLIRARKVSAPRPVAPPSRSGSNDQATLLNHWMKLGAQVRDNEVFQRTERLFKPEKHNQRS
jgi:hypothetical protein